MTREIYDLHDKAFSNVAAYVLMNDGERSEASPLGGTRKGLAPLATLSFKFPKDGAGRLWCYFHYIGAEMVRGYAGGYGYDKQTAAVESAITNIKPYKHGLDLTGDREETKAYWADHEALVNGQLDKIRDMFKDSGGKDWSDVFRDNNIQVLKAV